jgi:hypothetical protein
LRLKHTTTPPRAQALYRTPDGKPVATLSPDGTTLRKRIHGAKHFLRKPPAIATDLSVLLDAQARGVTTVEVTDLETGTVYTASLARILAEGFKVDRGHGEQMALPLGRWQRRDPRQYALPLTDNDRDVHQ